MSLIPQNLQAVHERIASAARNVSRDPDEVARLARKSLVIRQNVPAMPEQAAGLRQLPPKALPWQDWQPQFLDKHNEQ